jgi:CBS domain-containing protein
MGEGNMARYRQEFDDERDYYRGRESLRRDDWGSGFENRYPRSRETSEEYRRPEYARGRYGERADYEYNEPRYDRRYYREDNYSGTLYDRGENLRRGFREDRLERSRLRCHEIMTRDLAVATRDTTIREIAIMMKEEDVGVIPVVENDLQAQEGNGKTTSLEERQDSRTYSRGKLVGLITDRDIVVRAIADDKNLSDNRAEEIMSTDLFVTKPNDRLVDVIRKMGDKQVRRIPVVNDGGRLLGMISMADIARETEEDRELSHALEEISRESSFWRRIFH